MTAFASPASASIVGYATGIPSSCAYYISTGGEVFGPIECAAYAANIDYQITQAAGYVAGIPLSCVAYIGRDGAIGAIECEAITWNAQYYVI